MTVVLHVSPQLLLQPPGLLRAARLPRHDKRRIHKSKQSLLEVKKKNSCRSYGQCEAKGSRKAESLPRGSQGGVYGLSRMMVTFSRDKCVRSPQLTPRIQSMSLTLTALGFCCKGPHVTARTERPCRESFLTDTPDGCDSTWM